MIWFPGKSYQSGRPPDRSHTDLSTFLMSNGRSQSVRSLHMRRYRPHRSKQTPLRSITWGMEVFPRLIGACTTIDQIGNLSVLVGSRSIKSHQQRGNHQQIAIRALNKAVASKIPNQALQWRQTPPQTPSQNDGRDGHRTTHSLDGGRHRICHRCMC